MISDKAIERVLGGETVELVVPPVDAISVKWVEDLRFKNGLWNIEIRDSIGTIVFAQGGFQSEAAARLAANKAFDDLCDEETATVGEQSAEAVTPEDRRKRIEKQLRQVLQTLRPAEAEAIRQGYLKASAGLWELQSALSAHSDGPLGMELGSVKAARAIFDLLHLGNIV